MSPLDPVPEDRIARSSHTDAREAQEISRLRINSISMNPHSLFVEKAYNKDGTIWRIAAYLGQQPTSRRVAALSVLNVATSALPPESRPRRSSMPLWLSPLSPTQGRAHVFLHQLPRR